jgi:hypothetical protein
MAKTLVGVLVVSIAALLFAGCGGASSPTEPQNTGAPTTTTAKTVVSTFCGAPKTNFPGDYEASVSEFMKAFSTGEPIDTDLGHIYFVWSDASTTETAEICRR